MRKRTSLRTPKNPKASPNQTSGLIAKGQNPGQSVQEECVLDNRSHRTFRGCRRGLCAALSEASKASAGGNLFVMQRSIRTEMLPFSRQAPLSAPRCLASTRPGYPPPDLPRGSNSIQTSTIGESMSNTKRYQRSA